MSHLHLRPRRHGAHRASDRQPPQKAGRQCTGQRRLVEGQGSDQHRLPEVLPPACQLFPDADAVGRRADDNFLPLPKVWAPVERKLVNLTLFMLCIFLFCISSSVSAAVSPSKNDPPFVFVVLLCVWKRPLLTQFVVDHFVHLAHKVAHDNIRLDLFIVGSDEVEIRSIALSARAEVTLLPSSKLHMNISYVIHPNQPVGRKHQLGLLSLRSRYLQQRQPVPDAVAIFGSDDLVTAPFFLHARDALSSGGLHIFGLRDVWFYELHTRRLIYTPGYTESKTPLANTVGCGRVLSWAILDAIDWRVWDRNRDRGLDQSAVRHIMSRFAFAADISRDVLGRPLGILAVDVKSDAFAKHGINVWNFESVVKASADGKGRLQKYTDESPEKVFKSAFGSDFLLGLDGLRLRMMQAEH